MPILTKTWTTDEVSAESSLECNLALESGINNLWLMHILITPSGAGYSTYTLYRDDLYTGDIAYQADTNNLVPFYDPVKLDGEALSNEGPGAICYYVDEDGTNEFHLKIANQALIGRTYDVTISYIDLESISNFANSPMVVTGALIAEGTNAGTFKLGAGTYLLRTTDSAVGALAPFVLAELNNQAITAADTVYFVIVTYDGDATPALSINATHPTDYRSVVVGQVMKNGSDDVHFINGGHRYQSGVERLAHRARSLRELELGSGCAIAYQATNEFTMTAGEVYAGINKLTPFSGGAFDSAIAKFTYCWRDTDVWQYTADSTVINNLYYDDNTADAGHPGGVIAPNKFGVHWVYVHPDDEDVYVVYGRASYALAEAEQAQPPGDIPPIINGMGVLIGRIIIEQGASGFNSILQVTDTFFTGTAVADHGELGGLADDDHPQYIKDSEFTQDSGVLVGTGAGTFAEETGATLRTSLGLAIGTDVLAQQAIGIANDNLVEMDSADAASGEIVRMTADGLESRTDAEMKTQLGYITSTLAGDIDAVNNTIDNAKTVQFNSEIANGTKTTHFDVTLNNGQKQTVTLTANTMTMTFLNPTSVGNWMLRIVNGGLATLTLAATSGDVKIVGSTALSLTASGEDIIGIYYNGTDFYLVPSLDFGVPA